MTFHLFLSKLTLNLTNSLLNKIKGRKANCKWTKADFSSPLSLDLTISRLFIILDLSAPLTNIGNTILKGVKYLLEFP